MLAMGYFAPGEYCIINFIYDNNTCKFLYLSY